jgi:hypothetical protein
MIEQYSPLATKVAGVRDPQLARIRDVWGVLLHTTGRGVVALAQTHKTTPLEEAIKVYIAGQNGSQGYYWFGPHYVIDYDGKRYQIAPENALTAHAGGGNREAYLSGHWTAKCSATTLSAWRKQWPSYQHPYALFPSMSPNHDYIGVEMLPIGSGFGGTPMRPGLLFTKDQHDSAAELAKEIGLRQGFHDGWHKSSKLAGHEDVDIIERMDPSGHGGWDPGWLRDQPYFDFAYVRSRVG